MTISLIPFGGLSLSFFKSQELLQTQTQETLMNYDIYTEVTNRIITQLEQGVIPWKSPYFSKVGFHPQHSAGGAAMNANPLPPAIVQMTGPHPSHTQRKGKPYPVWRVAVVAAADQKPKSTVYRCLSYRRAVSLSCNMARDRRLHLHMEALPR